MGRRKKDDPISHDSPKNTNPTASGPATQIEAAVEDHIGQYGQSENTKKSYTTYTTGPTGGNKFLDRLLQERRKMNIKDHIPDEELAHALDPVPNRWSSYAITLYIGDRCCTESVGRNGKVKKMCGKATSESIYSAWVKLWTKSGYGGEYHLDKTTGKVTGCPAKSYEVRELLKSIKAREAKTAAAAYRHHAEAMSIQNMKTLVTHYSEGVCPNEVLENPQLSDASILKLSDLHGFMRAFMTTAFTLFSRNQETMNLKFGDLDLNAIGPAPKQRPHILVIMGERKGWIKMAGNDGPTCQAFEIFEQPKNPEIDMYTHLRRWLKYLSVRLGRPLESNDYIFPHIAPNGAIHIKQPLSYDTLAEALDNFRLAAGLQKPFTTHCFRRGGSQYRFMYAPPGERWTLNAIQWWGGWVSGEGSVDVLTRYLVDSMHTLENNYQHMLDPDRARAIDRQVFTGSNQLYEPASREDILDLQASLAMEIREYLSHMFSQLQFKASSAAEQLCGIQTSCSPVFATSSLSTTVVPVATPSNPTPSHTGCSPADARATVAQRQLVHPPHISGHTPSNMQTTSAPTKKRSAVPIPGVYIPNLPSGASAWRKALEQWEVGGEGFLPLKDWPPTWYTGDMRPIFGAKYGQRKLIAREFDRLERNEDQFLSVYPEAIQGISKLLCAIRARAPPEIVSSRRCSKNGSPSERDSRKHQQTESDSDSNF